MEKKTEAFFGWEGHLGFSPLQTININFNAIFTLLPYSKIQIKAVHFVEQRSRAPSRQLWTRLIRSDSTRLGLCWNWMIWMMRQLISVSPPLSAHLFYLSPLFLARSSYRLSPMSTVRSSLSPSLFYRYASLTLFLLPLSLPLLFYLIRILHVNENYGQIGSTLFLFPYSLPLYLLLLTILPLESSSRCQMVKSR